MMANKINVELYRPLLPRAIFQLLLLIIATASIVHKLHLTWHLQQNSMGVQTKTVPAHSHS